MAYEIKDGPYNPIDDKNFAPWAPKEGSEDVPEYIERLLINTRNRPLPASTIADDGL